MKHVYFASYAWYRHVQSGHGCCEFNASEPITRYEDFKPLIDDLLHEKPELGKIIILNFIKLREEE